MTDGRLTIDLVWALCGKQPMPGYRGDSIDLKCQVAAGFYAEEPPHALDRRRDLSSDPDPGWCCPVVAHLVV